MLAATLSTLCATLLGQELQCTPIEGTAGPQVCLCVTDPEDPEVARFCLADLGGVGPAREFLRTKKPGRLHFSEAIRRLDRTHLLLSLEGDLVVVDAELGRARQIGRGSTREGFVTTFGSEVVFHDHGVLRAGSWRADTPPRRLGPACTRVEQLLADSILATSGAELWRVDLASGSAELLVPKSLRLYWTRALLSPSGRFVALGSLSRIRILDLHEGTLVQQWSDFSLELPSVSSFTPELEMAWESDDVLVYSASRRRLPPGELGPFGVEVSFAWVRRRVLDGDVLSSRIYAETGLRHWAPQVVSEEKVSDPWFSCIHRPEQGMEGLFRRGRASALFGPGLRDWSMDISEGADFAVVWASDCVLLFQEPSDQPRHLAHGTDANTPFFRATVWLPATD